MVAEARGEEIRASLEAGELGRVKALVLAHRRGAASKRTAGLAATERP